jgi:branched-chain amino acid transport system permease protein
MALRAAWGALAAAAVAALACAPLVIESTFWMNILVFAGIYAIVAAGLSLLFGYAGQLSFGHGGFYGIGAYVSAVTAIELGLTPWLTIPLGALAAGAVGFVLGFPILRLRGLSLAMATLAFGQIMYVLFNELSITNGTLGLAAIPPPELGSTAIDTPETYYWLVLAIVVLVVAFTWRSARGPAGRALRAIGSSETAAVSVGVDVVTYKARTLAYSAGLAGLGGALFAHYVTFISSDSFTLDFSVFLVVIVAVGGVQSVWGAVLGALFMAIVPEYLRDASAAYSTLLYGALLTLVFMWAPGGIVGLFRREAPA